MQKYRPFAAQGAYIPTIIYSINKINHNKFRIAQIQDAGQYYCFFANHAISINSFNSNNIIHE